jgi:hypothetical protein
VRGDPREVRAEKEPDARSAGRAWGFVLGAWAVFFTVLALVVAPLLFSLCERVV